jgi:hypothetical protein
MPESKVLWFVFPTTSYGKCHVWQGVRFVMRELALRWMNNLCNALQATNYSSFISEGIFNAETPLRVSVAGKEKSGDTGFIYCVVWVLEVSPR